MKGNLVEIFFDAAEKYSESTAIIHKDKSISYGNLRANIESTATWLEKRGVRKESKVLVFIPMSIQLYEMVLALFTIGATVVFVDEWADRSRLKKALQVVPIDVIIAPPKFIWLAYLLQPFRSIKLKLSSPRRLKKHAYQYKNVGIHDTALITFTTGSTGLPKAANRTHHFLSEQFRILKDEIGAKPSDKCLVTLPIVLLSILGTGATAYVADFNQKKPEKLDAAVQKKYLIQEKITLLISSPYYIQRLCEYDSSGNKVRKIMTGGAPVFPDLARKINQKFSNSQNIVAYGSTEAEPISTVNMSILEAQDDVSKNGLLVGETHPEIELKIINIIENAINLDDTPWNQLEVSPGKIGEILVAGPHVLTSYYNSAEAFRLNKVSEGNKVWHRTGDSGRMDNGKLYLNGRSSQLIYANGQLLSPFVMEYLLSEIESVEIGTILKINEKIYVVVEARSSDEQGIQESLEQLLHSAFELRIVQNIPRDPRHFSKIDYKKLELQIT